MAKNQAKGNNLLKIVLAVVLIAVVCVAVFLLVKPKEQNPESVMTLSVNPEIQFVLDQDNKVISVNAMNDDGQALITQVNFVGKDADEVAKLFVKVATEAGYIHVDTTGTQITINISCEDDTLEKYAKLKESVKNSVNGYFQEIGVKAGAVVNVAKDFVQQAENFGIEAKDLANKTYEEVMEILQTRSNELKDVAYSYRDSFFTQVETLRASSKELINVEELIESIREQLDNEYIPETLKESLNKQLDEAEKTYKTLKKEFDEKVDKIIEQLKELSNQAIEKLETAMKTQIANGKALLESQIEAFNQNKDAILADIQAYQDSLK